MSSSIQSAISSQDFLILQKEQFHHDQRNHSDITCLPKTERLKHYGLHFAKYTGRLARGSSESKSVERTIVDTALICLSAANCLHQRLDHYERPSRRITQLDPLLPFCDAAGRFADACEKIDHLESFMDIADTANTDIVTWVLEMAEDRKMELKTAIRARRAELSERHFNFRD